MVVPINYNILTRSNKISDFDSLNELFTRLTASVETTKEIRGLFNSKHTHIFVAAFKAFTESGWKDAEFGKFLEWFVNGGNSVSIWRICLQPGMWKGRTDRVDIGSLSKRTDIYIK